MTMEEIKLSADGASKNDVVADHDDVAATKQKSPGRNCCAALRYEGNKDAQGYSWLGAARGAVVMSNIFLSKSLLYLAEQEAGCSVYEAPSSTVDAGQQNSTAPEALECEQYNQVHGMAPSALITNIAVISGLLAAFFMPFFGAIVDFTPHRRMCGIAAAALMTLIQAVQIGTTEKTWFGMAVVCCDS